MLPCATRQSDSLRFDEGDRERSGPHSDHDGIGRGGGDGDLVMRCGEGKRCCGGGVRLWWKRGRAPRQAFGVTCIVCAARRHSQGTRHEEHKKALTVDGQTSESHFHQSPGSLEFYIHFLQLPTSTPSCSPPPLDLPFPLETKARNCCWEHL